MMRMSTLKDLGLTLADVDLGAIDAEADHNLANHFIETSYAKDILNGRHEHVLGRKGSGKSALFSQLDRVVGPGVVVHAVTPDGVWGVLRQHEDHDNPNRDSAFVTGWTFVFALLAAQAIVDADRMLPEDVRRSFSPAHQFLQKNFPAGTNASTAARRFVKKIRSINLEAFGFGAGITWDEDQGEEVARLVIKQVMTAIEPAIRYLGLVVAIDQVDEGWDGTSDSKAMMIGLLRAAKDLNDKYGFRKPGENHLRIMVFLRSDIYEVLKFDEKDKHRPLEHPITWDREGLAAMVNARLPKPVTVDDLLRGGMRGDANPFSYIVARTFLRPREVLQFIGEAKKIAGPGAVVIGGASVLSAEKQYSSWKVEDLKQEYRMSDPTLAALLECLRQGLHRYPSVAELEATISEKAPELLAPPETTTRTLVEKLFDYSIVGIRVGDSGRPRYKAEEPQLALPTSGAVYVHPSLHKGLLIKEAKSPKKSKTTSPLQGSGESGNN